MDKLREECGVLGIFSDKTEDLARSCYYGLYALQHRGQESCGIVVNDDGLFHDYKDVGLVNDVFTRDVLKSLGEKEGSKPCSLAYKKATSAELRAFFAEVLPNFDQERVRDCDIKKLIQWYDILVNNGYTDFEAVLAPTVGDNVDNRADQ